jgi:Bacterial TSP3 repeat
LPSDDSDGDGLTNAQEFAAGTDPQSGASALRVSAISGDVPTIRIDFASVFGKSYQLEYKDDLTATMWTPIASPVAGTGAVVEASDNGAPSGPRFYRVRLL